MAWTEITREQYDRRHLRYASDCTDEEWTLIEPFMPAPSKVGRRRFQPMHRASPRGRPRTGRLPRSEAEGLSISSVLCNFARCSFGKVM